MLSDHNQAISFIIPAYNCQRTLAETVESIYKSNFTEGDEIIIIDDASTDDTLALAKIYSQHILLYTFYIILLTKARQQPAGIQA
jgi:glycosyltransferase involved in cell wall biosynthesis